MTTRNPPETVDDPRAINTGDPIEVLRNLEEPVSESFMAALDRKIQRRLLATDMGRLTWYGPILVVLETISMIFSIGGRQRQSTEGAKDE